VESDDRSQGFCFAEPPTGDEGKEGGGSEFNVDHGKGNGGDIKREGDDDYGAKPAKGNGKEPGQKTEFKSGGERESVVAFSGAGHPWIESNPENNCAEAKKDGVANAGRGRILPAVSGSEPKKKTENKKGANPVQPPTVLGKTLAKVKEPHKKGEGRDERESGTLQKTFHESCPRA
jgi:hypothetical protein